MRMLTILKCVQVCVFNACRVGMSTIDITYDTVSEQDVFSVPGDQDSLLYPAPKARKEARPTSNARYFLSVTISNRSPGDNSSDRRRYRPPIDTASISACLVIPRAFDALMFQTIARPVRGTRLRM